MYAVRLNNYGGREVQHLVEFPGPHSVPGQVRAKVLAAGINPVDVMMRDGFLAGWFTGAQSPSVPGIGAAATIDEIGEGIDPQLGITGGQDVVGGLLPLRVAKTFPAAEAPAAHQRFDEDGLYGCLIMDFDCGEHNITADIEVIPIQKVNEAYERRLKSGVKYRFSIDMVSLKSE
ncbi:alcohol dehydrogenase catalytic domain-containing protein [Methylosarcina fibrata]|uniref:alcohol dehydrogenase catalytic domain-containing protein n=1 Tax=Methylosarcina fibrata TaxID=105972 RepID=UPI00035CC29C